MKGKKLLYMPLIAILILSVLPAMTSVGAVENPPTSGSAVMYVLDQKYNTTADLTCTKFNVTVSVFNVTDLQAWEFMLWFDNTLLNCTGAWPTADTEDNTDFIPLDPDTYEWIPINNTLGRVWAGALFPLGQPFDGDVDLLTIEFHIILAPIRDYAPPNMRIVSCILNLSDTVLGDSAAAPIPHTALDGIYEYCRQQIIPGEPVADFTWTPPVPYVCDTVTCTDKSTPNGGNIIEWFWEITGPGTMTSANNQDIMTFHCDGVGSVYVTLTVWDSEGQDNSITKIIQQIEAAGCLLDIWTSPNRFCGQTTTYVGQGTAVNPDTGAIVPDSAYVDALTPDVNITIFAKVTWNGAPRMHVLVAFEILYEWELVGPGQVFPDDYAARNECIAYRTAETDKDGIAVTWFRVPMWCGGLPFGKWFIMASAKVQEIKQEDWIRFDVGYLIQLEGVETVDYYGDPENTFLVYCDTIGIVIYYKNIALMPKWVTFIAVVYDDCDVPIDQAIWKEKALAGVYCSPEHGTIYLECHVPQWTYVGVGKVYVSALTELPRNCGTAYCPEASATIILEWRGAPP